MRTYSYTRPNYHHGNGNYWWPPSEEKEVVVVLEDYYPRWTEEQDREIFERYMSGATLASIAKEKKRSVERIRQRIAKYARKRGHAL